MPLVLLFSGRSSPAPAEARSVAGGLAHRDPAGCPVGLGDAMDAHFPGQAWLRLDRYTFDRLAAYRTEHHLPAGRRRSAASKGPT